MKLAEALSERHDAQTRLTQITHRISDNAVVQEGDEPAEDVQALIGEAESIAARVTSLVAAINATNSATLLEGGATLTHALAERDGAQSLQRLYTSIAQSAGRSGASRYLRTELRMVSKIDVAALHKKADGAAKRFRELDTLIQQANWNTELVE